MPPSIRDSLRGTLGERHHCFNALVLKAYQQNTSLSSAQNLQEEYGINQLFKIDLASRQRNANFIIQTLKNDDLLYVSRALKSLWLVEPEYSQIFNPCFLENELFPCMRLQAVNKMKHWIHLHLRDPQRCMEFYQFYKAKDFDTAAKFLWHCSNDDILCESVKILEKITPKHLKVLSEKVPQVTKIYFDNVRQNKTLLKYYLVNNRKFFANIKYLLKTDAAVFFYILENFFDKSKFQAFKSEVTKYIMKHHKNRFIEKPELYTAWFLNMEALAKCLKSEEIKELLVKLAKAEYLGSWFSYKTVEPLIKHLSVEDRSVVKKLIFVNKEFGPTVKEWQYPIPDAPMFGSLVSQGSLFEDEFFENDYVILSCSEFRCHKRRSDWSFENKSKKCLRGRAMTCTSKSLLTRLYDQYRFNSYTQTLVHLQKRLKAESSSQNRQYMLLVLVSKTGGRAEDVASFLDIISPYKNEPVQIRAAIVRSLVKRAFVWRLSPEHWARLLEWGHGLGLDGSTSEVACREGLHAVVMRELLAGFEPSNTILEEFLKNFSTFCEYSLTADERRCFRDRLPALLLSSVRTSSDKAINRLNHLLDTLAAYHIRFDVFPGAVEAIAALAKTDFESAKALLNRLYKSRVTRKTLMREHFEIMQTDASYVNALRHNISILENTDRFKELLVSKHFKHEQFLRKLSIYFTEKDGLAEKYTALLRLRAAEKPDKIFGRPLALLIGSNLLSVLKIFDATGSKTPQQQLAGALRANAHVVRPACDLESFGWRSAGAKATANRVITCQQKDVERYLTETLAWSRTLRIALVLAKRVNKEPEVYEILASKRPGMAFSAFVRSFRHSGDSVDIRIWDAVKRHIKRIAKFNITRFSDKYLNCIESIPAAIRAEYYVLVYKAYKNSSSESPSLDRSILSLLPEIDDQLILEEINEFLEQNFQDYDEECGKDPETYTGIISIFLILSTSEEMLEERFQKVGIPFFALIEQIPTLVFDDEEEGEGQETEKLAVVDSFVDLFLLYLRCNKVFFDVKYMFCLPLFEKVKQLMLKFMPIEKWFSKYVMINLSMIYFRAVRYSLIQSPELFSDESKKIKDGPHMLGTIFGKFVSSDIEDMTHKYFPSITELYAKELVNYFNKYFYRDYLVDESVEKFTVAFLNALLSNKTVATCVLAKYVIIAFQDQLCDVLWHKSTVENLKESGINEIYFIVNNIK